MNRTTILILLLVAPLVAQLQPGPWLTYGNGSDGNLNFSTTYPYFVDGTRAKVTNYANTSDSKGNGLYTNTLTITCTNVFGAFTVDDRLLIINHKYGLGRNYDLAIVTAVSTSGSTVTLTAWCARESANKPHIPTGTQSFTQVLRVPQFHDVILPSLAATDPITLSQITCAPWDPVAGSGGILAFTCNGTLNVSGSFANIRADYKGEDGAVEQQAGIAASQIPFTYIGVKGNNHGTWGTAASGGNAPPVSYTHLGALAPTIKGFGCTAEEGGNGGCGGNSLDGTGPYPRKLTLHELVVPSRSSKLLSFATGGYSGIGGQGPGAGGHGGGGGAGGILTGPGSATDGMPGVAPIPGSRGGFGGEGGTGGGAIYIKANYIVGPTGTSNLTRFYSLGKDAPLSQASRVDAISDGGDGGSGGEGGDAACTAANTFYGPGGGGGHGTPGNGADGGGGGNGGNGGPIWVTYGTAINFSVANLSNAGGAGATGGEETDHGRWEGAHKRYRPDMNPFHNGASINACAPNSACTCSQVEYGEIVDVDTAHCGDDCFECDSAMYVLGMMQQNQLSPNGNKLYQSPLAGQAGASNLSLNSYSEYKGNYLITYASYIRTSASPKCSQPGTARVKVYGCKVFDPLNTIWNNIAPPSAMVNQYGIQTDWGGGNRYDYVQERIFYPGGSESVVCYPGGGSGGGDGGREEIIRPRDGKPGPPGEPGAPGEASLQQAPPNNNDPEAPALELNEYAKNVFSLALSPNPTRTRVRVTLELGTSEQAQLKLMNMQGQSLQLHQLRGSGKLTEELDVSGLSPGNYIISVQAGEKRQDALLLVQ